MAKIGAGGQIGVASWKLHIYHVLFATTCYIFSIVSQAYGYLIGIIVFFATLKFTRLLRFNKRMSLLGSTLNHASGTLFQFFILFMVSVEQYYCQWSKTEFLETCAI